MQVYQVDEDGGEVRIHTLFPGAGMDSVSFRQVMDPALGADIPRCYRVVLEDSTGTPSATSVTDCWQTEEPKDSGGPGDSVDTAPPTDTDTAGPVDTDSGVVPTDSVALDTGTVPAPEPPEEGPCGCGLTPLTGGWMLALLAVISGTRRQA
jgi:hypothetical protein